MLIIFAYVINVVFATSCPMSFIAGPWLGGTCNLVPGTLLTESLTAAVYLDMNSTSVDCMGGAGLTFSNPNVTIANGRFVNCVRRTNVFYDGGGALKYTGTGTLVLKNFECSGCSSRCINDTQCTYKLSGGCVYASEATSRLVIEDSTFNACWSSNGGAASSYGSMFVTNSIIHNSNATSGGAFIGKFIQLQNTSLIACTANNGGGIYVDTDNTLVMNNSVFRDCSATGVAGGGICSFGNVYVANSEFQNCSAFSTGGGISVYSVGSTIKIQNTTFTGCKSVTSGGAVHSLYPDVNLTITTSTFTNCTSASGGGVYTRSNTSVACCDFHYNTANAGAGVYNAYNTSIIRNSSFVSNTGVPIYTDVGGYTFGSDVYCAGQCSLGANTNIVFAPEVPTCKLEIVTNTFVSSSTTTSAEAAATVATTSSTANTSIVTSSEANTSIVTTEAVANTSSVTSSTSTTASTAATTAATTATKATWSGAPSYITLSQIVKIPITTSLDVVVAAGTTFVIPYGLKGPMVATAGTIQVNGDIIIDISDFPPSTGSIWLFSQDSSHLYSLTLTGFSASCYEPEWGSGGVVLVTDICAAGHALHVF